MNLFKTLALVGLVGVFSLTTLDAETIEFTISPTVGGLGTNPVLNFKKDGEILSGTIPISQGSKLTDQAAHGFANPLDAVVFITWLQQTGRFVEYRSFMNRFVTLEKADQEKWTLMNSDQILLQQQTFLKNCSDIKPLLIINRLDGSKTLFYVVQGDKHKSVFPISFKVDGGICKGIFSSLGNRDEAHILYALMEQIIRNRNNSIEYHKAQP